MTESIRIPLSPIDAILSEGVIITPDLARQIVALADVFGEENWQPLEKRIAALEARKYSGFIGDVITIGGSGKSTTQDASSTQGCLHIVGPDGVAHPAGTPGVIAAIPDIPNPTAQGDEAADSADLLTMLAEVTLERDKALAELAAEREKREKMEAVCVAEVEEKTEWIHKTNATRTQVAALAGLLRRCKDDFVSGLTLEDAAQLDRDIDAALAAAGEGK